MHTHLFNIQERNPYLRRTQLNGSTVRHEQPRLHPRIAASVMPRLSTTAIIRVRVGLAICSDEENPRTKHFTTAVAQVINRVAPKAGAYESGPLMQIQALCPETGLASCLEFHSASTCLCFHHQSLSLPMPTSTPAAELNWLVSCLQCSPPSSCLVWPSPILACVSCTNLSLLPR